jgi:vancomycin permeability regulator SanA
MDVFARTLLVTAGLLSLTLIAGAAAIGLDGLHDRVGRAELAIVPGNPVRTNGRPSRRLQGRLDAALDLYQTGRCRMILVSGTTDANGIDESAAMKAYLVSRGVPNDAIVADKTGDSTMGTARFAAQLIRSKGLGNPILVSQFFHISRLRLALEKQGISSAGNVHSNRFETRDWFYLVREVFAYGAYAAGMKDART